MKIEKRTEMHNHLLNYLIEQGVNLRGDAGKVKMTPLQTAAIREDVFVVSNYGTIYNFLSQT